MEYIKTTKLLRVGTSLGIVIPRSILNALVMDRGDQFYVGIIDDKTIGIRKVTQEDIQKFGKPLPEIN